MGGGEFSFADLVSQIRSFYLRESEFDHPFSTSKSNVLTWWHLCNPVHEEENHIQKLALKILSIRCIAHHVNLISTDICKTTFAKEVISKCQKIVKYFKQSHQAGEELREKITNEIKGGGLKTYVVTRWTTAWNCTNSILQLEQILKNVRKEIYFLRYIFVY